MRRRCLEDKPDWDKRYKEGFYDGAVHPHEFLKKFWEFLPAGGRVVDIAMGTGRDLLFLARQSFHVYGLDRSWEGLKLATELFGQNGLHLAAIQADALRLPLRLGAFDGVVVFYFLEREIMGELKLLLKPGGVLFYETFLKRQNEIDRRRNPAFLRDDGELHGYFRDFETLFYEEGIFTADGRERAVARYIGRKR
jgi:tellurite methyltransferase